MLGDEKYGSPQKALTVWKDNMVSQGFGYRLGVDLPGEQRGFIPNAGTYDRVYRDLYSGDLPICRKNLESLCRAFYGDTGEAVFQKADQLSG